MSSEVVMSSDLRAAAALVACDPDALDSDYGYDEDVDSDAAGFDSEDEGAFGAQIDACQSAAGGSESEVEDDWDQHPFTVASDDDEEIDSDEADGGEHGGTGATTTAPAPKMPQKLRKLALAALVLAAAVGWLGRTRGWRSFCVTGNGYGAKIACGAVFGANRTLQSVLDAELVFPPVKYFRRFAVDKARRCLTVSGIDLPFGGGGGDHATTACWQGHRLGCHITSIDGTSTAPAGARGAWAAALPPSLTEAPPATAAGPHGGAGGDWPWPLGDAPVDDTDGLRRAAEARVDLPALRAHVDAHFGDGRLHARAFVLLVDGVPVYERYGNGATNATRLLGWSASKSLLNAMVGARVQALAAQEAAAAIAATDAGDAAGAGSGGRKPPASLTLETPLGRLLPGWRVGTSGELSDVGRLRVKDLLRMADGLDADEAYVPVPNPVTEMLFANESGVGGAVAAARLRAGGAGCFHYSSPTTNILCRALEATFASHAEALAWPTTALFGPLGARSFRLETDGAGTFVGSSFGWATARDWARLALLFQYDGMWWPEGGSSGEGGGLGERTRRLLPEGWVDFSRTPTPTSHGQYGAHFWLGGGYAGGFGVAPGASAPPAEEERRAAECDAIFPTRLKPPRGWLDTAFPRGTYLMHGFEEQCVAITPSKRIVVVRLGASKELVLKWNKTAFYGGVYAAIT